MTSCRWTFCPATAVVTRITYGARDRAVVRYLDGSSEEIPLERLTEFVTERQNPDNVKNVNEVDVDLASLEPYRGIRFVDTPGLGSVFAHNTRTSLEWLPEVGAAPACHQPGLATLRGRSRAARRSGAAHPGDRNPSDPSGPGLQ